VSSALYENKEAGVNDFLLAAYNHFNIKYPKFYKMDQLSKLGWLAAELLLKDSFDTAAYEPETVGVVLSNANSSLDTDIRYFETTQDIASPALFVYTLPNIVTGEICIRHRFKGENAFFITEEFDAGFTVQYVNNLFNNNILQCCICGWVELLGNQYKTALFLVEKGAAGSGPLFTTAHLIKTYRLEHG
jgi:hypothetical protein